MCHNSSSIEALLTQSLREKPNSYLIDEILHRFPTVAELVDATVEELLQIKGVGKTKAKQIVATIQLSQLLATPVTLLDCIRSPQDVVSLLGHELKHLKQEHFMCILLNTKNCVISRAC